MTAGRQSRLGMAALCLGAVLVLDRPVPSHAAAAQAVTAPGGLLAYGHVPDARFGDATRWVSAILVIPAEPVVSTGSTDGVDLAKPWAVMTVTSADTGEQVCGTARNPSSFNPGRLTPGPFGEAWRGTYVDIDCEDGAGYLFYRATWDPGAVWIFRNPLAVAYTGRHLTPWSASSYHGVIETMPVEVQRTGVTVCGYRTADSQPTAADCFGEGSGYGTVIPTTERLTAEAAEVPL